MKLLLSDFQISPIFLQQNVCFGDSVSANRQKSTKKHFIIFFFGFKIGFTGPSVERLDKSTDFTTAWTTPFPVYSFGLNHPFCWIPSHVGTNGNDLADHAGKDASNDDPSSLPVPYTDRRRHINSLFDLSGKPSGMWLLTITFMSFSLLWVAGLEVGVTLAEK